MKKSPSSRLFAPLLVATVGLPGRGKSLLARRLCRYLNFTGDVCKGELSNCARKFDVRFEVMYRCLTVGVSRDAFCDLLLKSAVFYADKKVQCF